MCRKCDSLQREIARTRELLVDLTDPSSIVLAKADIIFLEEKLATLIARHRSTIK
jgi:hypothetical protein